MPFLPLPVFLAVLFLLLWCQFCGDFAVEGGEVGFEAFQLLFLSPCLAMMASSILRTQNIFYINFFGAGITLFGFRYLAISDYSSIFALTKWL